MVLDVVRMLKSKPTVLVATHMEAMRACGKVVTDGEFEELMWRGGESLRG